MFDTAIARVHLVAYIDLEKSIVSWSVVLAIQFNNT